MGKKKGPLDREMDEILNQIYAEEEVDATFNECLSYDYDYVKGYLDELGYDIGGLIKEDRLIALLAGVLSELEDNEDLDEMEDLVLDYLVGQVDAYDPKEIESLPYYQLLKKVKPFKEKGVVFEFRSIAPYTPFLSKNRDFSEDIHQLSKPNVGCFTASYLQPTISKGGEIWMSLIPHEIETMREAFSSFKGNVLIYGLGLGYAAFEASNKKEVDKVTVIEKDKAIVDLFKKHILPLFPNRDKVEIVLMDAIDFAKGNKNKEYDVLFADLWRTGEDGLPLFAKLRKNEGAAKENHYWIEEEIYIYLRRLYVRYLAYLQKKDSAYIDDLKGSPYYDIFLNLSREKGIVALSSPIVSYLSKDKLLDLMEGLF
ncbi:MAG: hypothetical protein K6B65_02840 [Bacilli bacterium]|nr:hypothetical protein [Bacilli bacterium]